MEKKLGKITKAKFGIGGYQDACIGLSVALDFNGSGVHDGRTAWDANKIECSDRCEWTEKDRSKEYDEIMRYLSDLLHAAKVDSVDHLVGIPVEATFNGMSLDSWRVLTEVL